MRTPAKTLQASSHLSRLWIKLGRAHLDAPPRGNAPVRVRCFDNRDVQSMNSPRIIVLVIDLGIGMVDFQSGGICWCGVCVSACETCDKETGHCQR